MSGPFSGRVPVAVATVVLTTLDADSGFLHPVSTRGSIRIALGTTSLGAMTTTDVILGGAIVLLVVRQLRGTFLDQLHADRRTTGRDLARIAASAASGTVLGAAGALLTQDGSDDGTDDTRPRTTGWGARAGWVVSVGARLAFLIWLDDVTDGAAFSPFGFAQDLFGGTVWHPVLVVLGLSEGAARLGAIAVRAVTARGRSAAGDPAVPVPVVAPNGV